MENLEKPIETKKAIELPAHFNDMNEEQKEYVHEFVKGMAQGSMNDEHGSLDIEKQKREMEKAGITDQMVEEEQAYFYKLHKEGKYMNDNYVPSNDEFIA